MGQHEQDIQAEKDAASLYEKRVSILKQLADLDTKIIRPLSEGEPDRVSTIVSQKAALRLQLEALT